MMLRRSISGPPSVSGLTLKCKLNLLLYTGILQRETKNVNFCFVIYVISGPEPKCPTPPTPPPQFSPSLQIFAGLSKHLPVFLLGTENVVGDDDDHDHDHDDDDCQNHDDCDDTVMTVMTTVKITLMTTVMTTMMMTMTMTVTMTMTMTVTTTVTTNVMMNKI